MQVGMIGLGRMGLNMAKRLAQGGHAVAVYNRNPGKAAEAAREEGITAVGSLEGLAALLSPPRVVWLMLPAGKPVDDTIAALKEILWKGDLIIDGGNSFYKDDIRRAEELAERGLEYMDVGVSGGVWGLKEGYCLMAGGKKELYTMIEPLLKTLAPEAGYLHCGGTGAGHFVKMTHNGIEYGMMAAYGEGFQLLQASPYAEGLDLKAVAHLWNRGSVVRSWLLELAEAALSKDPDLSAIKGHVADSGEGRWTVQQAVELGVPLPVIALSLFNRFSSRETDSFSDRLQAALRNEFGGHGVVTEEGENKNF